MAKPSSFLRWALLVLVLGAAGAAALAWELRRNEDARYWVYEWVWNDRFHRYDAAIQDVAKSRGIDPMLIKAVVWRESRFRSDKLGLDGERGLMQITEAAASEWAKAEKPANYVPADLFDPKTNLEAGSWLLSRALKRYQDRDDPVPFALAEYNAGRSRAARWARETDKAAVPDPASSPALPANSKELRANINIASTRYYVQSVLERTQFYHERGRL